MDTQIVAVLCLCDDVLQAVHHLNDRQCQMSNAEVITAALVAALYFRGNFETMRRFLQEQGYMPRRLSKRRFNRRLHRLSDVVTTGSRLEQLIPKSIHAVTARGFELKVGLFVVACSLTFMFK